jgi:uncharacterized delta-60 repeat protein
MPDIKGPNIKNRKNQTMEIKEPPYRSSIRLDALRQIALAICLLLLPTMTMRAQCAIDSFAPEPNNYVQTIVVQPDGKILVGGEFNSFTPNGGPPVPRYHLARLNADGTLDTAFDCNVNCNMNGTPSAIAVQGDGKVLVGGSFSMVGGQIRRFFARLDGTTGHVDAFDAGVDPSGSNFISALTLQPDGKILVGGIFTSIGGQTRNRIARLDPNTGLADSFDPNPGSGLSVITAIALQADGKIVVAGSFGSIGGQLRNNMARLDPITSLADSFNPIVSGSNTVIQDLVIQGDGKILVGGRFSSAGGQTRRNIARLDPNTGLADSFNPNALPTSGMVQAIALQPDGKILAGGSFTNIGGQPRIGLARLDPGTGVADSFDPHSRSPGTAPVLAVAATGDGKIYSGGTFTTESGQTRNYLAQLNPACTPTPTPGILLNISTRLRVLSGDNVLIGGMINTGIFQQRVIIRAIGPSLNGLGVPGVLEDPTLDLFRGSSFLGSNDDWQNSEQQAEIAASGFAPSNPSESAIVIYLIPGEGYTAIVRGKNGTTGVGVVEAYDLDQPLGTRLANISTRGFVDVDNDVMIAGVIVGPPIAANAKILARALGPSLSDLGVPGALADPTLDLVNSSGTVIRSNNNWQDDPSQRALIEAAGLGPGHLEEAALMETVAPGAYTAIVRGNNRTNGVGLVEVYHLP